jgi:hypothetical protein
MSSTTTTTTAAVPSTTPPNSTAAATTSNTSTEDDKNQDKDDDGKKKKDDEKKKTESNPFLDHLGKIFLLAIASIIVTLVRSTYNTSNRNKVRDYLEEQSVLDPKEFEDFREANSELNLDTMKEIISIFYKNYAPLPKFDSYGERKNQQSQQQKQHLLLSCSYREFVQNVRTIMSSKLKNKDESFTIELGHLLDRMIVGVLEERNYTSSTTTSTTSSSSFMDEELPIALFWTAFISAMNGPVSDRIRILHEVLVMEEQQTKKGDSQNKSSSSGTNNNHHIVSSNSVGDGGGDGAGGQDNVAVVVPLRSIRDMVGYLQDTCQLPPDTQIVATDTKFPTQQWKRASPQELVPTIKVVVVGDDKSKKNETTTTTAAEDEDDDDNSGIDIVEFAAILRTKSVCAWGECYQKWKPGVEEFFDEEIVIENKQERK